MGRRAVRLALLVGAVFVLGVLCGEQARAADGGPAEGTSSVIGSSAPTGPGAAPGPNGLASVVDALTVPRPDAADPVRPLTGTVVRSVDERVVRPVGDLVGAVTDRLDEATQGAIPGPAHAPGLARAPGPARPAHAPRSGTARAAAGAPAPARRAGADAPRAEHAGPAPGGPDAGVRRARAGRAEGAGRTVRDRGTGRGPRRLRPADQPCRRPRPARTTGAGPRGTPCPPWTPARPPAPHAPGAPGAPAGRPDGATGGRSAADHGTPRHGDAYAVTAHHRPSLRLVPGATARAEAAGTRDPYRDVPVSPA
ncbi:hypothetical protein GCM10023238_19130 [Streptomyces heliomycini]